MTLNVVILHCHFRRGGVTQVVENHVAALANRIDGQIVLVSGGRNDGLTAATIDSTQQLIVADFDYDDVSKPAAESLGGEGLLARAVAITDQLVEGLRSRGLSPDDTILHWHNHSLGKNLAAPLVIERLAETHGFRQLLQIHDFAEDFRPENYLRIAHAANSLKGVRYLFRPQTQKRYLTPFLYPRAGGIGYATLTSGDAAVLAGLGMERERIHILPNSVSLGSGPVPDQAESLAKLRRAASLPPDARWSVYPVRGIRRKNVGEFLLLSRLLPAATYAGITLPPATAIERASYERWRELGSTLAPKAIFDAGTFADVSFHENLAAADFILSTSVAEGFGMAFLEPWLAGRGVVARRLPGVVNDFTQAGVRLDRFYDSVLIPGTPDWLSECARESRAAFQQAWQKLPELFGEGWQVQQAPADEDPQAIDFATLTTPRQIEVLRRVAEDPGFEKEIQSRNGQLVDWLAQPFSPEILQANADQIASQFSLAGSGRSLASIYDGLLQVSCGDDDPITLDEEASAIDLICGQRTFFPCRTELEIAK